MRAYYKPLVAVVVVMALLIWVPVAIASEASTQGTVQVVKVQALISTSGKVLATRVPHQNADPVLVREAVRAVRASQWKPAMNDGKPVKVWIEVPVNFTPDNRPILPKA